MEHPQMPVVARLEAASAGLGDVVPYRAAAREAGNVSDSAAAVLGAVVFRYELYAFWYRVCGIQLDSGVC